VSAVTWFDDDTAARLVAEVRPESYVKGADYAGQTFPEAEVVRAYGGEVFFADHLEGRSTTKIVERINTARVEVAV
jgi:bifunctional ADP-heptose synthase (sugar kinase/adenylyltransferase)